MNHKSFSTDLPANILSALKHDNPKAKESNNTLSGLKCPSCGKFEAWAYTDKPFSIICNRKNECGEKTPAKSVYSDLWQDLAKRYPPTPSDKKATARAYLESRGLKPDLIEFEQGFKGNHHTLTLKQDGVTFDHLIDYKGDGEGKNRLTAYKGKVYQTKSVATSKSVFICEGVIDALSLEQSGLAAIATYSSGSIPKDWYQANKDKEFILAFDNDAAGIKGIQKTITCFKELGITYKVALAPIGKDWNDLLVNHLLVTEQQEKTLKKAYWQGELTFATSAEDYFLIYCKRYPNTKTKLFEFDNKLFKGYDGDKASLLADCTIRLLHSVINDSEDDKQTMEHYIRIYSNREGEGILRLDAAELVQLNAFKTALQNHRQLFYGNSDDLNHVASYLFNQKPPKIRALTTVGYDEKSNGFYYPKFAYDENGKRIEVNGDKYFTKANIKPFMNCSDTIINNLEEMDLKRFITQLHAAYGNKGLLALGFYVATQFSHLIFEKYGFFPFLSLYGDPHAGKSFITKLLNRCFFVDGEGQTMTASNTAKGELRKISQKSSMVCCLLEGRTGKSRFDYDGILPLYNRNAIYSRATTSQDNRTHDLALKAALSFVWNHECFILKPAKERVISLHFADADLTEETSAAWEELNSYSPEQLTSVGDHVLRNRKSFESELISWIKDYSGTLKEQGIKVARIANNHAIALAGVVTLLESLKIDADYNALMLYTVARAKNKLETAKSEAHTADYFFSCITELNTTHGVGKNNDEELVIHLPTVLAHLQVTNNGFPNRNELIAELKRHDRFIEVKPTRVLGKLEKCYHFKRE